MKKMMLAMLMLAVVFPLSLEAASFNVRTKTILSNVKSRTTPVISNGEAAKTTNAFARQYPSVFTAVLTKRGFVINPGTPANEFDVGTMVDEDADPMTPDTFVAATPAEKRALKAETYVRVIREFNKAIRRKDGRETASVQAGDVGKSATQLAEEIAVTVETDISTDLGDSETDEDEAETP